MRRSAPLLLAALVAASSPAAALPDLSRQARADGATLIGDHARADLAYLVPPPFELLRDETFAPQGAEPGGFLFITRYVGSEALDDLDRIFIRSHLRFRIGTPLPDGAAVEAARARFADAFGTRPVVRDLPLSDLRTELIAEGVEERLEGGLSLDEGIVEGVPGVSDASRLEVVLPLDAATAQLFSAAAEGDGLVMSFAYTRRTRAFVEGAGEGAGEAAPERTPREVAVLANTISVPVTTVKRFDLDHDVPPGYPVLRVFNFDFVNDLRPDLALKEVEIAARSVGGDTVRVRVLFLASELAIAARSVRFPFAVDLSEPYRYRLLTVSASGAATLGDWHESDTWTAALDISTPPGEQPDGPEPPPAGEDAP